MQNHLRQVTAGNPSLQERALQIISKAPLMIAISYRREDSLPIAGRLYDRLQAKFGRQNVFMDFDSIPAGVDFRERIKQTIERSDIVVAVIGPRWLGERIDSSRRIDEQTDFVRLEIKYALEQNVPVIPLLVDNTPMPKPETLPPEIERLAFRNALPLDSGIDFHNHAERLINSIRGLIDVDAIQEKQRASIRTALPPKPRRSKKLIWGFLAFAAVVGALFAWLHGADQRDKVNKPQQVPVTPQPTPVLTAQPAQTVTIVPQPTAPVQPAGITPYAQPTTTEPSQSVGSPTVTPHPIRSKTISIENGALSIDGVIVQNIESVLGKPERVEATHRGAEIDIWDSIGLRVLPNEPGKPYLSFDVFLNDEDRVTNCPEKNYQGELLVERCPVSSTTNIKALNASLGSKALAHTDTYGGGNNPVYTGQYSGGGLEIICDSKGIIQIVSVLPGGLPKNEPSPETPEQRRAKDFVAKFVDSVKKGDFQSVFPLFQHTAYDPKAFTLDGFLSYIRHDDAFSQIKSVVFTRITSGMGLFTAELEITRTDGRKRNAKVGLIAQGESGFQVTSLSSGSEKAPHEFPDYTNWSISPSASPEATTAITTDMVREVVKRFVSTTQSDDLAAVIALYAPKVHYRDEGEKDSSYIRKDLETYHRRWPIRQDNIEGDITVDEKLVGREYAASCKLNFYVESAERHEWVKGQAVIALSVIVLEAELKVSAVKEKVLQREPGKFPGNQPPNKTSPTPSVPPTQYSSPSASSKIDRLFVGTWEGSMFSYTTDYSGKTTKYLGGDYRLVIDENGRVATSIFYEGKAVMETAPANRETWFQQSSRTLSTKPHQVANDWTTWITVNRDGRSAEYTSKSNAGGDTVNRGTLYKKR
jgi:hypothetical protein